MNGHLKSIEDHLKSLDDKFQTVDRSNVKVEELLAKVPKLDEQINEIRVNVSGLPGTQKTINDTHERRHEVARRPGADKGATQQYAESVKSDTWDAQIVELSANK